MHPGSPADSRTPPARRPLVRLIFTGLATAGVVIALLLASGLIPLSPSSSTKWFRMTEIVVSFSGSGAAALCPATAGSPPTCGSAAVACDTANDCGEPLRSGEEVGVANGIRFRAMLSDTFDCNYTFSIAQVSSEGAFSVTVAEANGAALPVNVGFTGSQGDCVTEANISVGFTVGDRGPSEQGLFLTVSVAQELR